MTTQATTPTQQGTRDGSWLLAGMTALTVSAILAAVLWQLRPSGQEHGPSTTAAITAAVTDSASHAAVPAASNSGAPANEWVYLVSTQADADALQLLVPESLVVVADADQAAVWLRVVDDMDPQRFRLIDRRRVSGATTSTGGCGLDTQTPAC